MEKYLLHPCTKFTINAKNTSSYVGDEYEKDARVLFEILVSKMPGAVTERVLELYDIWDNFTEIPENPIYNAKAFLEALDEGEIK